MTAPPLPPPPPTLLHPGSNRTYNTHPPAPFRNVTPTAAPCAPTGEAVGTGPGGGEDVHHPQTGE